MFLFVPAAFSFGFGIGIPFGLLIGRRRGQRSIFRLIGK